MRSTLVANVDRSSKLMTDESNVNKSVGNEFASHQTVNHSFKEYGIGEVTTNTVEGFFSIFKRRMRSIYQLCSEAHLHRHLAKFYFRYCHRVKLRYSYIDRTSMLLEGIVGKRLTYRQAY